jgi:hypothetical protein
MHWGYEHLMCSQQRIELRREETCISLSRQQHTQQLQRVGARHFDLHGEKASSKLCCRCGHLFCWPCLYKWMLRQPSCPVCKDCADETRVVPIYTRHSPAPSSSSPAHFENGVHIPSRPAGLRLLMPADAVRNRAGQSGGGGGVPHDQLGQGGERQRMLWWPPAAYQQQRLPVLSPRMQWLFTQTLILIASFLVLFLLLW